MIDKEKQNIEWKETWKEDYLKWICGFANAQGGKIYIGKNDDGTVTGIANAKKLLEDIPNKVRDVLGIIVDVNLYSEENKDYLEIVTLPSSYPVNYKGEYHYRSGSTKQLLKGTALTQFLFEKTGITWDSIPLDNLSADDFWRDSFDIFRKQAILSKRMDEKDLNMTNEQLLDSLGLIKDGKILRAGMMLFHHDIFRKQAILSKRMDEKDLNMTNEQLLDSLGLIKDGKILRAGMMLFHQNPEKWINGAYIKIGFFESDSEISYMDEIHGSLISQADKVIDLIFTKYLKANITYEGVTRVETFPFPKIGYFESDSEISYMDEIHGSLISQADKVIDLIFTKYLKANITYEGVTRVETYPFPKVAIREAVYNAIVHKNYATQIPIQISIYKNKLYISNDCILPSGWTVETLMGKHRSKPFNPNIANGFFRAGFIETWGRGIEKICEACRNYGTALPEYTVYPEDIMIKFEALNTDINTDTNTDTNTDKDFKAEKLLEYLKENPKATQKELAEYFNVTKRTIERNMNILKKEKFIERIGNNRSGYWRILK